MSKLLSSGSKEPIGDPTFEDFELAKRIVSGGKLRPGEGARADDPDPDLAEALFRIQHTMESEIAAARAVFVSLSPKAGQAMSDLLESDNPQIKLGATRLWTTIALPPQAQRVEHSLGPDEKVIAGTAAVSFAILTEQLQSKLQNFHAIDVTTSQHVFRGPAARPLPGAIERPDPTGESGEPV